MFFVMFIAQDALKSRFLPSAPPPSFPTAYHAAGHQIGLGPCPTTSPIRTVAIRPLNSTPLANSVRFPRSHGIPSIPPIPALESVGIDVPRPSLLSLCRPTVLRPGLLPFTLKSNFRDRTRHRLSSSTTASQLSMETFTGLHSFLSFAWYVFCSTYRPGCPIISIFLFSLLTFVYDHLPRHRTPNMARPTP